MLIEVAPDLYTAQAILRRPGGVRLPVRMTVMRLSGGELCVHSPVPADGGLFDAVAGLGRVAHIVAPNRFHHLFVKPWVQRFPAARVLGAPGLPRKRADLRWAGELGAGPVLPGVDALPIEGAPRMREVTFLHRSSGSLIVSDLLFNVVAPEGVGTRLLLTMTGTRGRLAMSRVWRLLAVGKAARAALCTSLQRLLEWDFVRILPGHGDVFQAADGAETRQRAREALAWGLQQDPKA